jgi:hypothetical protein
LQPTRKKQSTNRLAIYVIERIKRLSTILILIYIYIDDTN